MLGVLNRSFDNPQIAEEHAVAGLAGGILQHGCQCGMLWGASLAAGAESFRRNGPGAQAETLAIVASQRLVSTFRQQNEHLNCLEITHIDRSSSALAMINYFLIKGGFIGCLRMAARYAPEALKDIESGLADRSIRIPEGPVSCASLLAAKLGLSEGHQSMVAGLAGGIGLSGGACGALGALIWIIALQDIENSGGKLNFNDPAALDAIERFLNVSDNKFECVDIIGRKFADVQDHAEFLRCGGCSGIIDILTSNLE